MKEGKLLKSKVVGTGYAVGPTLKRTYEQLHDAGDSQIRHEDVKEKLHDLIKKINIIGKNNNLFVDWFGPFSNMKEYDKEGGYKFKELY